MGDQLGFYRCMADDVSVDSTVLSERTATDERYVRERLEQQAVAGLVEVKAPADGEGPKPPTAAPGAVMQSEILGRFAFDA